MIFMADNFLPLIAIIGVLIATVSLIPFFLKRTYNKSALRCTCGNRIYPQFKYCPKCGKEVNNYTGKTK